MLENINLINTDNNEHQINLDENLLGEFEITILPQDDLGLGETSTKVNLEIITNVPGDLPPKLKALGFKVTNFSDANSFTGTIDRESLTQIIPLASQVTFPGSPSDANSGDNESEEVAVYATIAAQTTSTATDSEAASLINLDDFQQDARFARIDGSGYSIVILDTGIDLDHEAFGPDNDGDGVADRIVYHYDFADNDTDARDVDGHGSHVSSIGAGIAPGADIIHLKVFGDNSRNASRSDIEEALQWVVANGSTYNVASVNLSLGSGNVDRFTTTYLSNEYAALAARDIVVSVASGNNFANVGSVQGVNQLSADPNVISVGAVYDGNVGGWSYRSGARAFSTGADRIIPFSQRHETLTTIFAPGASIRGANANGGYSTKQGTSQAAPYVAGIVPLAQELAVREIGRRLTVRELRNLLRSTGVTINDGDDEIDNVRNTGLDFKRVNVQALGEAIVALGDGNSSLPNISLTSTPVTQQEGDSGTTAYAFTVTLDKVSDEVVTVNYSINDVTTTADADYVHIPRPLIFNPGETRQNIIVLVNGDTTFERDERFTVFLYNANNGIINPNAGNVTGTILNDDVSEVNGVEVTVNGNTVTYEVESYGGLQDRNPIVTIDGTEVEIEGNGWKKLDLGSYNITDNTVLEFEFRSTAEGEIHGIGFDTNNRISSNFTFQLHGTQRWGIQSSNDYITGEGWKSYQISVGDFLTGQARYLTLVNDDDRNAAGISEFRNIQLYENVGAASLSLNNEELVDPFSTGGSDILTNTVSSDFLF